MKCYKCSICENVTFENEGTKYGEHRMTYIGWVCPNCYPLYKKIKYIVRKNIREDLTNRFNKIIETL